MKTYDPDSPLFFIHIPKTAGTSVKKIFTEWYGDGLLPHYYDEISGSMPPKYDLSKAIQSHSKICAYGHFNRKRGFGLEDYYPGDRQLITIIRDPFERAVSGYFFRKKVGKDWQDQSNIPKENLREYLRTRKTGLINFFPRQMNMNNYKEVLESSFIEIGVTEHLDESLARIASKINKSYVRGSVPHLNAATREHDIPYELKDEFINNNQLDFQVYEFALRRFG